MSGFELKNVSLDFPAGFAGRFRVLDDLNLTINSGEKVAVVGPNGAGKSTFLRMLAGIYPVTYGQITFPETVDCLFDLTAGMEEDATGLQNIYLRADFLRISRDSIEAAMDDILAFAGLGEAIKRPLRTYSAGMRLRVAFSVLKCAHSDCLLVDEVIGVGDLKFFQKSLQLFEEIVSDAGTVVIASHALSTMQNFCDTAIWIEKGGIKMYGPAADVIGVYSAENNH